MSRNHGTHDLPLPDDTYQHLRAAAERSNVPATVIAREAIDFWLRQHLRKARYEAIAAYAAETAGTTLDLDAQSRGRRDWELVDTCQEIEKR